MLALRRVALTPVRAVNRTSRWVAQQARHVSVAVPASPTKDFAGEPEGPAMVTPVPGPKSQAMSSELDDVQNTGGLQFFVDFEKSQGNYVVDADGNRMLDAFSHIASLALGYNHPAMKEVFTNPDNMQLLAHRPALGNLPPLHWGERLKDTLLRVGPKGLDSVTTLMCGSCSNENAFKLSFMRHAEKRRGGPFTAEDEASCMENQPPGTPNNVSVLSFRGGFHGRLLGVLSCTRSKALHKVDIPAFDWPATDFPALKYPPEEHAEYNAAEEARCLAEAEKVIVGLKDTKPVVHLIIEPIQAEGGDRHASADFFRKLRELCLEHDVMFHVDEVQTGAGPTGRMWAHEEWELATPPDIVTFSKKTQIAGFYCRREVLPKESYRIFGTWMGDPIRTLQMDAVMKTIEADNLLENVTVTGDFIKAGLEELQGKFAPVTNVRGKGTFVAFDLPSTEERDAFIAASRNMGLQIGGCGTVSVRVRPALIFQPKHAAIMLDITEKVLDRMYN